MRKIYTLLLPAILCVSAPLIAQGEVIDEVGNFVTLTAVKLRAEPSTKSANIKCRNFALGTCPGDGCPGETGVLPKGHSIRTKRRTNQIEKNSGASGYWYQIGQEHEDSCDAWIFGGLLKKE